MSLQVGTCSALSGLCTCPAGWTGFNCLHPMKRFCTHAWRAYGFEVPRLVPNLTAASSAELSIEPRTHCAGAAAAEAQLWLAWLAMQSPDCMLAGCRRPVYVGIPRFPSLLISNSHVFCRILR